MITNLVTGKAFEAVSAQLDGRFVSPLDFERVGFKFSGEELLGLSETLPSREKLTELFKGRVTLVCGPNKPMTVSQIIKGVPSCFDPNAVDWCCVEESGDEKTQEPFRKDLANPGWFAIRQGLIPRSTGLSADQGIALLGGDEMVPNVAEAAWVFMALKMAIRGDYVLNNISGRTSSKSVDGSEIFIGRMVRGYFIGRCKSSDEILGLGTLSLIRVGGTQLLV